MGPVTRRSSPSQLRAGQAAGFGAKPPAELIAERLAALRQMSYRQVISTRLSAVELQAYAALRGYKKGWVWHRLQAQRGSAS
jgi:hypothetical protein